MNTRDTTIPLIDIAGYLAGNDLDTKRAAQQMNDALERVGFFAIVGHDVDWQLVEGMYAQARRFHDLPLEVKEKLAVGPEKYGYLRIGQERIVANAVGEDVRKPSSNEAFSLGSAETSRTNQWPSLPGFREAALSYLHITMDLAYQLVRLVAVALDLEADYFAPFFGADGGTLRISHYPVLEHEENQWGLSAHTDGNFFTLLPANDVPGLSIRPEGSDWIDADVLPRCFLVNSGDMLRRWTNNRYLATEHRVKNVSKRDRYAIPTFYGPKDDALIAPLPTCIGPDRPSAYEPIVYLDYKRLLHSSNVCASTA